MFVFDLIYNIILLLSLVANFSTLIMQGLEIWTWWWFGFLTKMDWNLFCDYCYCIFHLFTPFKRLFASTSGSPMSKILRFLESLGKNNENSWSQIVKLLLIKDVKLMRNKNFVFRQNCVTRMIFFSIGATIRIGQERLFLFWKKY